MFHFQVPPVNVHRSRVQVSAQSDQPEPCHDPGQGRQSVVQQGGTADRDEPQVMQVPLLGRLSYPQGRVQRGKPGHETGLWSYHFQRCPQPDFVIQ